jgi:hypothetical protein
MWATYTGLAPGTVGLYQVNFQLPEGATGVSYLEIILEPPGCCIVLGTTNFVPLYVQ